jgi:D-alanine transaminase
MSDIGYLNGHFSPLGEIKISPDDRGFLFGDGVYEVIRAYHGVPAFWGEHFKRLVRSAREIQLHFSLDQAGFHRLLLAGLQQSEYQEAKIYIQVTRGVAPREHTFPSNVKPTVFLAIRRMGSLPTEVCQRGVSVITVPDIRWHRCDIKSLNLLPNVLAKQQAREAKAFEGIFVRDGLVTEGATSNIFVVKNGVLITPELNHLVLPGVTQQQVATLAQANGLEVQFRPIPISELLYSDEVFLVGTTIEVLPVIQVDEQPIQDGKPGPISTVLQQKFSSYIADLCLQ